MSDARLVLVFDDGYAADYERIRPVLSDAGVPACFAVVPAWLDTEGHLTAEQTAALADRGHEIAAHGRRHRYLQAHGLAADADAGSGRVRVAGSVRPAGVGVRAGDRHEVTDGDRTEVRTVASTSETADGPDCVEFEAPLERPFEAGEAVLRPTEAVLRDEIRGVREDFDAFGVDPKTFVFPYDAADPRAWQLARGGYRTVANAAVRSLPNPPGTSPTEYRRYYLETDSLADVEIRTYLDALAEIGGVGVLAGHSAWETMPAERVARVIDAARERGVDVTTFEGG